MSNQLDIHSTRPEYIIYIRWLLKQSTLEPRVAVEKRWEMKKYCDVEL